MSAEVHRPGPTEVVIEDITILYDSVMQSRLMSGLSLKLGPTRVLALHARPPSQPVSYQDMTTILFLLGTMLVAENL